LVKATKESDLPLGRSYNFTNVYVQYETSCLGWLTAAATNAMTAPFITPLNPPSTSARSSKLHSNPSSSTSSDREHSEQFRVVEEEAA